MNRDPWRFLGDVAYAATVVLGLMTFVIVVVLFVTAIESAFS